MLYLLFYSVGFFLADVFLAVGAAFFFEAAFSAVFTALSSVFGALFFTGANLRYINAEFVTVRDEENKRANNNSYEMSEYNNMLFVSYTADITDTGDNTYTGAAGTLLFGNVMIDETGTLRFEKAFYSDVYATVTDMDAAVIGNFSNNYTRDNSVSLEGWN